MQSLRISALFFFLVLLVCGNLGIAQESENQQKPIQALLVTGGSLHDYQTQKEIVTRGIRERVSRKIEWMVRFQGEGRSDARIPLFESSGWADGYDIVVHNYCFPRVYDPEYVDRILAPHIEGTPAVLLHGTMQSFRVPDRRWASFCGVSTRKHGSQHPFAVSFLRPQDPILQGIEEWETPKGELYFIESVGERTVPLTESRSEDDGNSHVTAWKQLYGEKNTRVFGTTVGNDNKTMAMPSYLDTLARGFLWALDELSEDTFQVIAPEDSLTGFSLPDPDSSQIHLGSSLTFLENATALTSNVADGYSPENAVDGDLDTFWEAGENGAASLHVKLSSPREVGAVAIEWKADPPQSWLVERSVDGKQWQVVARSPEKEDRGRRTFGVFESQVTGELRITVPQTRSGERVAIREFAAYASQENLPAEHLLRVAPSHSLHTVGETGLLRSIRLAPGWTLADRVDLPVGYRPRQLLDTASGQVFVLAEAKDGGATVFLVSPKETEGTQVFEFLVGVDPEATIAWDGEWLYLLSHLEWTAYRDTSGDHQADERFGRTELLQVEENERPDIRISDIRLAMDGWCYGIIACETETTVRDNQGRILQLPRHGIVRFQRDARRTEILLESPVEIGGFFLNSNLHLVVQTEVSGGGTEVRRLLPIPGDNWLEEISPIRKASSPTNSPRAWEGFLLNGEEMWGLLETTAATGADPAHHAAAIASFQSQSMITAGVEIPLAAVEAPDGSWVLLRLQGESAPPREVILDDIRSNELVSLFESASRKVRLEAAFEILRRKREWHSDVTSLLRKPKSSSFRNALALVSLASNDSSLDFLLAAAKSKESALAFRLLGTNEGARNHPVFQQIVEIKDPEISSEILYAIEQSQSALSGIEELAFAFVAGDDPTLSSTATNFLRKRDASSVCFAALDNPAQKQLHPAAMNVLSGMYLASVAEGIVLRMEQATDPELRKLGLKALCSLHHRKRPTLEKWKGSPLIESFLSAYLGDPRVDPVFLLNEMARHGIPVSDIRGLFERARNTIALEPFAIDLFLQRAVLPDSADSWLREIAENKNRDDTLRAKAVTLLLSNQSASARSLLPLISEILSSSPSQSAATHLRQIWRERSEEEDREWLLRQARSGNVETARLAWLSLVPGPEDGQDKTEEAYRFLREQIESGIASGDASIHSLFRALVDSGWEDAASLITLAQGSESELLQDVAEECFVRMGRKVAGVQQVSAEAIAEEMDQAKVDVEWGRSVFARLGCSACHNVHGEGPLFGPDIVEAAKGLSSLQFAETILGTNRSSNSNYRNRLFELTNGMSLEGIVLERAPETLRVRDILGNEVEIDRTRIRWEWENETSLMGHAITESYTPADLASLKAFLKHLAGPPDS